MGPSGAKRKNMETGLLGDKMGRVHMEKQEYDKIALAKMSGLKRRKRASVEDEDDEPVSDASSD